MPMDLCDHRTIQALLQPLGFHFSRAKGQNFLTDRSVPVRIADACGADTDTGVVEIGPGIGCLTEQLAMRAGGVLAFEVDDRLRPVLAVTLAPYENIEVVFRDVMEADLAEEISRSLPFSRHLLCANLPYSITTPVLRRILESGCFSSAVVMVQREVAERICAGPGEKEYGAFTLLVQWYARAELLFEVGPGSFMPQPKVSSAVVRLTMREGPPFQTDEKLMFRLIRAAFNMRRKTLVNALSGIYDREDVRAALSACGFSETIRGEALSLEDFCTLADHLKENTKSI